MAFLTDLATSMTKEKVKVVIFSGNDDALLAHRGSEGLSYNITMMLFIDIYESSGYPKHDIWRCSRILAQTIDTMEGPEW